MDYFGEFFRNRIVFQQSKVLFVTICIAKEKQLVQFLLASACQKEQQTERPTGRALKNIDREKRFDTYKTSSNVACCNQRRK